METESKNNSGFMLVWFVILAVQTCSMETNLEKRISAAQDTCSSVSAGVEQLANKVDVGQKWDAVRAREMMDQSASVEKQKKVCDGWSGTAWVVGGRSVLCAFGYIEMHTGQLKAVRAKCESSGGKYLGFNQDLLCDLSEVK